MSLKHRNVLAWILIVVSAALWIYSQSAFQASASENPGETSMAEETDELSETPETTETETEWAASPEEESLMESQFQEIEETDFGSSLEELQVSPFLPVSRILSGIFSLVLAFTAVFFLYPKSPLIGPDGAALAGGSFLFLYEYALSAPGFQTFWSFTAVVLLLLSLRELWGWFRNRYVLSWCLSHRIARLGNTPCRYLITVSLWFSLSCSASIFLLVNPFRRYLFIKTFLPAAGTAVSAVFSLCCLRKYGRDLSHLELQLNRFQEGLPIAVKDGTTFSQTEYRLMEIQKQHEEAIHTAVASERFKVELISNVSHDLRTPLTAILGYGELLQKEALSPDGEKQLFYLNQKAGYMRNLVEDLFELTKVSSGVVEAKKEEIDLIRLFEQTIGLFNDQLAAAGLLVRRHYDMETAPVVTDGGRLHQVAANLLGNAVKYALAGTRIHLEITQNETCYLVRMVNTASYEMDFEPEEILQRFTRGDKSRSTQGSGIGLAIAQTYTESVGGKFRISIDADQFNAIITLPKN